MFRKLSAADIFICVGAVSMIVSTFLPWYGWESIEFNLWDVARVTAYIFLAAGLTAVAEISGRVLFLSRDEYLRNRGPLLEGIAMLAISGLVVLFALIRLFSIPEMDQVFGIPIVLEKRWGLWIGLIAASFFASGGTMKFAESAGQRQPPQEPRAEDD